MPGQTNAITNQPSVVTSNSTESEPEKMVSPLEHELPDVEPPVMITTSLSEDFELPPPPPAETSDHIEYVRAVYDYEATNSEEISFSAGDLIKIIDNSSEDGWWTGENKEGAVGHFLSMLVCGMDEDEEETSEDEEDDEPTLPLSLPNLPPSISVPLVASPVIEPTEIVAGEEARGEPSSVPEQAAPPTFAPPPKPMTLMTPQTVVIIQPTPEIESKPMIGSEDYVEDLANHESSGSTTSESYVTVEKTIDTSNIKSNGETARPPPEGIKVSMAIAAQEVSQTITQQAMDDSMRELSRRPSAASSQEGSIPDTIADVVVETENLPPLANQPNGDINNGGIGHDEEDCK